MNRFACAALTIVAACVTPEPEPEESVGLVDACASDEDCLAGVECENAWCRDDGTCRRGTATGFPCGDNGMCVEHKCIER